MSHKLSTILVGVYLSEPSFNAVYTATKLAAKENATLYLVYAHETVFERIVLSKKLPENESTSASILAAMASDITRKSGVKTNVIIEDANAAELILRTTVSLEADLVVLGTYGASGYRNGHTGTNAYTVAKYAPCPVLLVPGGRQWAGFSKPIYPVRPVVTAMRHYPVIRKFIEPHSSLLVFGLAAAAGAFIGYASEVNARRTRLPVYLFGLLVSVVIIVILDLDRPSSGFIKVSQQPMIDTAAAIAAFSD